MHGLQEMSADATFFAVIAVVLIGCAAVFCIGYAAHALWNWIKRDRPPPACPHHVQSGYRWTQDGWVSVCLVCREWLYGGEDYEGGPPA